MLKSKAGSSELAGSTPTRFTYRAFFVGTLCTLVIGVVFPYARLVLATAGLSTDYITAGAVFLFFILMSTGLDTEDMLQVIFTYALYHQNVKILIMFCLGKLPLSGKNCVIQQKNLIQH